VPTSKGKKGKGKGKERDGKGEGKKKRVGEGGKDALPPVPCYLPPPTPPRAEKPGFAHVY